MKIPATLPRPRCRISVPDRPEEGWTLDFGPLLIGGSPRQAWHALDQIRARPATLEAVFTPEIRARIRAGTAIAIEDTAAAIGRFLAEIGGEAGYEQWAALAREEARLRYRSERLSRDLEQVARARCHDPEAWGERIAIDAAGRFGSVAGLSGQAAWELLQDSEDRSEAERLGHGPDAERLAALRGRVVPYLWAGRSEPWQGLAPAEIERCAHAAATAAELQASLERAWLAQRPTAWDDTDDRSLPEPGLGSVVAAWWDGPAEVNDLCAALAAWQDALGICAYGPDPDAVIAVHPGGTAVEIALWIGAELAGIDRSIAELPDLWRSPAGRFTEVERAMRARGIKLTRDWRDGSVRWLRISEDDPMEIQEHGPFLTLELALEHLTSAPASAGARPSQPEEQV